MRVLFLLFFEIVVETLSRMREEDSLLVLFAKWFLLSSEKKLEREKYTSYGVHFFF